MIFLKNIDNNKRKLLQLSGYLKSYHLEIVEHLTSIPSFKISKKLKDEIDISLLEIPNNLRFGNRLEYFFEFYITQSEQFKVLLKNLQIVENKRTIGELDFIIQNLETKEISHVEITNKFYLYDSSFSNPLSQWIGPNRNDSLLKKTI